MTKKTGPQPGTCRADSLSGPPARVSNPVFARVFPRLSQAWRPAGWPPTASPCWPG